MKQGIHEYRPVVFMDTTTGFKFYQVHQRLQVKQHGEDGNEYPLLRVEITRSSPILHRSSKFTQADGRGSFQQKYGLNKNLQTLSLRESLRKIRNNVMGGDYGINRRSLKETFCHIVC